MPDASVPAAVTLEMPARPENLVLCRLALVGLARTRGIDAETLADLKLAVTEACSNAMRHAYETGEGGVRVRFLVSEDAVEVEVEDEGRGFGVVPPPPDQTELAEPGMGLGIIRALTDELELRPGADGRGSLVRFRKLLG